MIESDTTHCIIREIEKVSKENRAYRLSSSIIIDNHLVTLKRKFLVQIP
jgi:hypothetical protein